MFIYNSVMKFGLLKSLILSVFLAAIIGSPMNHDSALNEKEFNNVSLIQKKEANNAFNNEVDGVENEHLEANVTNYTFTDICASFRITIEYVNATYTDNNYIIGNYGSGDRYQPALFTYVVKRSDGTKETRTSEFEKSQTNNEYDGIGDSLGDDSLTTYIDVDLAYGEEVLYEEGLVVSNIFVYDSDSKTIDFNNKSFIECNYDNLERENYVPIYDLHDFFKLEYTGRSTYSGYSTFSFDATNFGTELYPTISATTHRLYNTYEKNINEGKVYIKSSLYFTGNTSFIFTFKDGSESVITSSNKKQEITNNGVAVLLFEGVDASQVSNIIIDGLSYELALYNTETKADITRTPVQIRFGKIYTYMYDLTDSNGQVAINGNDGTFNINNDLIVGLLWGCTTIVFFGIVTFAYFYLKKKNRNDEFKRMNTKQYWTTATYGYLCIESVLLLITYITIRASVFNNSLTVYNPTDVFIVVFGVASIILVGYFIRYFVVMIKNNIEKRRRDRLNINQDVIDDGTLIVRK